MSAENGESSSGGEPSTGTLEIEADDKKTHALLRALIDGERQYEKRVEHNPAFDEEYLEYIREWKDEVDEVYFADREVEGDE